MTNNTFVNNISKKVGLNFKKVVLARTNGSNENFFKYRGTTLVTELEGKLIFIKYDFSSNRVLGILKTSNIEERSIGRFATRTFKTHSGTKYYYNDPEKFATKYYVTLELFEPECYNLFGIGKVLNIEQL